MKKYMIMVGIGYVFGVASILGGIWYIGHDGMLTLGAKWEAASRTYAINTRPVFPLDESLVASAMAEEPKKKLVSSGKKAK